MNIPRDALLKAFLGLALILAWPIGWLLFRRVVVIDRQPMTGRDSYVFRHRGRTRRVRKWRD